MTISNLYIKCLKSEKIESGARYGQFLINSLRPGQGITVGNLLRRVLLSDLGGTTITAVRIAGVRDEFSIIPGVREDVLEILLNLKGIVFQTKSTDVQFGRLKVKGPAVITADAIQGPSDLKIVNLGVNLEENKNYYVVFTGASEEQKIYNEIRDELNNNNQLSIQSP